MSASVPARPSIDAQQGTVPAGWAAAWASQCRWMLRAAALGASHPDIWQEDAPAAVRTGPTGAVLVPPGDVDPDALDRALAWLRRTGCGDVQIWSAEASLPADRWLSARGARESFRPHWMTRSLDHPLPTPPPPGGIEVRLATARDIPALRRARAIPYTSPWQLQIAEAITEGQPDTRLLIALRGPDVVGHAVVHLADGPLGLGAGLYDVGVDPAHRRRGIGRALTLAALESARDAGVRHATLNATPDGERLYRAVGFTRVGEGRTWSLPEATLHRPPPPQAMRFALAISGGEPFEPAWRHLACAVLPSRDTPLGHAARFGQRESALSLLGLGTLPDIVALWDLGLRAEAHRLMADPAALALRTGPNDATALHLAIVRADPDLLEALLAAGADPHLRDGTWHSDARGWAHAIGNDAALHRLQQHVRRR